MRLFFFIVFSFRLVFLFFPLLNSGLGGDLDCWLMISLAASCFGHGGGVKDEKEGRNKLGAQNRKSLSARLLS